jgi:hypothetical protein
MVQDPNRLDARVSVLESVTVQHTNTLGEHAHSIKETAEQSQQTKERLDFHVNFVKGVLWVLVPVGTVLAFILSQAKELIAHTLSK